MNPSRKRTLGVVLIVALLAAQAGNAWAMPMVDSHVSSAVDYPVSMMAHDHHDMEAGSAQDVAMSDTGCDKQTSSSCLSCGHCVAVLMVFGMVADKQAPPHSDRTNPAVTSITRIHFKPPRSV